ncbi:hypothetical protein J8L70_14765 [Pseudoalteromonas sp. MMG010]|uniref:hypothetical protein n=1 Tax=Pseudoalteromonas sp. MMG010 TaxID=2822685 RepID=UPI001B3A4582|nr:hypothetical protein [Pseudoalteromonas sp. MMG010]MBQ4834505.1 hypothetical protein [Pseudoalteromonas sp. MMG010]
MKLYPYAKIKTENLKGLLFASRVLAFLSYAFLVVTVIVGIIGLMSGLGSNMSLGNGAILQSNGISAIMISMWGVACSVALLAFSGLCAAVVSCEYKYTRVDE